MSADSQFPPRTQLNRLLLGLIAVMTLAIIVLGLAVIWKLFLADDEVAPSVDDATRAAPLMNVPEGMSQRSLASGSAAITYTVPEGCQDTIETGANSIAIIFTGETCGQRQVQAIAGDVTLKVAN